MSLRLDFCTARAATYAVMRWHYSRCMPVGKIVRIGVWEDDRFIGVILYGRGAAPAFHKGYGLKATEVAELVRIALHTHRAPVSQLVAISFKLLKKASPGLRLLFSFADPRQDHHGGIYQAGNWVFTGSSSPAKEYLHNGVWKHPRSMQDRFGKKNKVSKTGLPTRPMPGKYRYLYPLDRAMQKQLEPLKKPYPKRQPTKRDSRYPLETGGAEPTLTLPSLGSANE